MTDEQLLVVFNDTRFVCDRSQRLAKELINKLNVCRNEKNKTEDYFFI